jgi:hypothetical protein
MVKKSDANDVKIRVTKLGADKVSTGVHVAASGEVMAHVRYAHRAASGGGRVGSARVGGGAVSRIQNPHAEPVEA